ncbi:hypothetical protein JOC86_000530 [Bacillus pakistanensis]|uniref:Uncharacterized protein n=1 Tax=Rossellomorea pakistanensis TaxID=992288 RepID=A0ABS2N839_9BACI|nr:hypothetical protein [Bacillus pakistanensis]MBM7583993.1 hypothetical protein [Bacillus pakistanensis]
MFGLSPLMTFMLFVFWPVSLIAAGVWGGVAFKNEEEEEVE